MTEGVVSKLAISIACCGVVGIISALQLDGTTADRTVGALAIVAMALAVIALRRRSWTRLPLLVVCVFAYGLIAGSLLTNDDATGPSAYAYTALNVPVVISALVAFVISRSESNSRSPHDAAH